VKLVLVLAIALVVVVVGCESADRREANSVVTAITRFRQADNASTPSAVEALKSTPCSVTEVCKAKDACVAAGEATAKALTLKSNVERSLAKIEKGEMAPDSPEAKALATKLDEAETLLKQGHESLPACDEQVQALKRKHRL
jgi:hypothetical protein